ncbi:MAG: hypothetical protein ACREIC_22650, partial [Limisphaerales bacterium]
IQNNGTILDSTDGSDWAAHAFVGVGLSGLGYGNGSFVAVGPHGTILESGTITSLALTPGPSAGALRFSLTGQTGLVYTVQSSTNLVSWQTVTNITPIQSTTSVFDIAPVTSEHVFYRAYSQ